MLGSLWPNKNFQNTVYKREVRNGKTNWADLVSLAVLAVVIVVWLYGYTLKAMQPKSVVSQFEMRIAEAHILFSFYAKPVSRQQAQQQ